MKLQGFGRRLIGKLHVWKMRLYVAMGMYPKYAIRQIIKDNPDIGSLTGNGLHVFVAIATNEYSADSIRFGWLRRALDEGNRMALIKMDYGAIFSRIAAVTMPTFYRALAQAYGGDTKFAYTEYSKETYAGERARYRSICKQVFEAFHVRWRVDAVVNSGVEQYWAREAIVAARELNIPWLLADSGFNPVLAVDREPMGELFRRYYPFEIDLLLAHSGHHAGFFQACGVPPERIRVTGEPKFDYWSHPEVWPSRQQIHPALRDDRILILYFAFQPQAFLQHRFPGESRDWGPLRKEQEQVLEDIATRYPQQVQIVYKSGHVQDLDPHFHQRIQQNGPSNLMFIDGKHLAQPLIVNSDIIVGFQSTATIEALFSNRAVVYAGWGQLHDDIGDRLHLFHHTRGLIHAKSAEHLREVLTHYLDGKLPLEADAEMLEARAEFRERYFYKPDGNSSRRVLEEIERFLIRQKPSGELADSPQDRAT